MGRTLERRWRASSLEVDRQKAISHLRVYKKMIFEAKSSHLTTSIQAAASRPRELFNICKPFFEPPAIPFSPPQGFAEDMAEFFDHKILAIRTELAESRPILGDPDADWGHPAAVPFLEFTTISVLDVLQFIAKMGPSSSLLDPIPTPALKSVAPSVASLIHLLVNWSLSVGWVPADWKAAVITPLLKKVGLDSSDKKNFRPVSQLPLFARISEHFVTEQLQSHCEAQGALHDFQSGFRPGRGTETAILDVRERLAALSDAGKPAALVLLDLSAAFDTIDHELLLRRLESVAGVGGHALGWCRSFLSGRRHQVHVGDQWSEPRPLRCGVPQGSALSPLLFNIYMRPLTALLEDSGVGFQMYADDTQLVVDLSGDGDFGARLIPCLERIKAWMHLSWLRLNETKTELLVFARPSPVVGPAVPWPTSFGDCPTPVEVARNLGVFFHRSGSASAHVSAVVKGAHFKLNQLSPVLPLLDREFRATLCLTLVISKLQYCCSFFTGLAQRDLNRLQGVQNRAVRAVTGLRKYDHVSAARRSLGWLRISDLIMLRGLCIMWRALHMQGPAYLQHLFQWERRVNPVRPHLRGRVLVPRFVRARAGGRCLSRVGPRWWNTLPVEIRLAPSFTIFKMAVKRHLRWLDQG